MDHIQTVLVILAGIAALVFLFKKFFLKSKKKNIACASDCNCH